MHEMSLAESLLQMAIREAESKDCDQLLAIRVEYGPLAGIMPEALELCFNALVSGSRHANARLELVALPLLLQCPFCGAKFGGTDKEAIWRPCPSCGEEFGHTVLQGRELLLSRVKAQKSHI